MKAIRRVAFAAALWMSLGAVQMNQPVSFADVLGLKAGSPNRVISYGPAAQQFGELWLPEAQGPHPLVVFIHGGCWLNEYDVGHSAPLSAALKSAGYAVWSVEYRRIGDPDGGWPGTLLDIGAAIDHVRVLAREFPVDESRVVVSGHSAGGHLALWGAARPDLESGHPFYGEKGEKYVEDPVAVRGAIGLAAIADLDLYARGQSSCERATLELMGGSPEVQPERYAAASPARLVPWTAPTHLLQGQADPIVPGAQASALVSAAAAAGQQIQVSWVDGAGHFDLIHPHTPAFRRVLEVLGEMLPANQGPAP